MGKFQELKVWQRAKDLAVYIYRITEKGKYMKDFGLRDQWRRAVVSIPSNIAEGDELGTDKQSVRHFYIAKGSSAEVLTQAIIAWDIGYLNKEEYAYGVLSARVRKRKKIFRQRHSSADVSALQWQQPERCR